MEAGSFDGIGVTGHRKVNASEHELTKWRFAAQADPQPRFSLVFDRVGQRKDGRTILMPPVRDPVCNLIFINDSFGAGAISGVIGPGPIEPDRAPFCGFTVRHVGFELC